MKTLILIVCLFITKNAFCQFDNSASFNKAIGITMTYNTRSNLSTSINFGIQGNRLPITLMVGADYMELDDKISWGYNATAMIRLYQMDEQFACLNANVYSTAYKQSGKILYEYGGKMGAYLNDKSIMYLSAGYTFDKTTGTGKGEKYKTITIGASFSLLL